MDRLRGVLDRPPTPAPSLGGEGHDRAQDRNGGEGDQAPNRHRFYKRHAKLVKDEKELARKKAAEAIAAAHESNRKQFEAVGLEYDVVRR